MYLAMVYSSLWLLFKLNWIPEGQTKTRQQHYIITSHYKREREKERECVCVLYRLLPFLRGVVDGRLLIDEHLDVRGRHFGFSIVGCERVCLSYCHGSVYHS